MVSDTYRMKNRLSSILCLTFLLLLGCVTPPTDKPNEQANSPKAKNQKSSKPYIIVVATYLKLGQKDTKLQRLNLANEKNEFANLSDCKEYVDSSMDKLFTKFSDYRKRNNQQRKAILFECMKDSDYREKTYSYPYIIYASLYSDKGETDNFYYSIEGFISESECRAYLDKKYKEIERTLKNHLTQNSPNFSITYLSCAKKSKLGNISVGKNKGIKT
jgi:hypothetical protein